MRLKMKTKQKIIIVVVVIAIIVAIGIGVYSVLSAHLFTLDGKVVRDGYDELVDRIKSIEDGETKNEVIELFQNVLRPEDLNSLY